MKKKNDIKFIIYQSLYIFVICVIAIKGADINLDEVEIKHLLDPKFAYIDTTINKVYPADAKLIPFDSTKFMIVSIDSYKEHPENYPNTPIQLVSSIGQIQPMIINTNTDPKNEPQQQQITNPVINAGEIILYQYHQNPVNNSADNPITISGITIPAHSTKIVSVSGEGSVLVTSGNLSKTINVRENQKPKLTITRVSGTEKLSQLQSTIGYRVTITDDFAEQLDVKLTGPISSKTVKQTPTEIVIDVTLNAFGSKQMFDSYIENHSQDAYTSSFNVNVSDKYAPHKISQVGIFKYREW